MADKTQKHRTNQVFKSLHKPLTYLGVERTLFYFVCVGAVGAFNLFNSILAGIAVFIGGFGLGFWFTNSDPAYADAPACLLLGRADPQRQDTAYQRWNRHRQDNAFADIG